MIQQLPQEQSAEIDARRLVLASSSTYRRALLSRLGLPFDWCAPDVDEAGLPAEEPEKLVKRLALAKARAVAARFASHLIIGSDQVAVLDGSVIGKPGGCAGAIAQLEASAGRRVSFLTSVCVLDARDGRTESDIVRCEVEFRSLTAAQIAAYVAAERPYDCAGSFKSEGLGIALFKEMDCPDPSALMGLPLIALVRLLGQMDFDVLKHLSLHGGTHESGQNAGA